MYNTEKNGVRIVSDKATREHLKKIKKRFMECIEQNISIEAPIQKLMLQDMHTLLDLCFGPQAIQDERFYLALCPFFSEIEEFLPNIRVKVDKFYTRIYQLSDRNPSILQFILDRHYSSLWIINFGLRNGIDMVEHHSPYFPNIINLPPFLDIYAERKQYNVLISASEIGFSYAVFLLVKKRHLKAIAYACLGGLEYDSHSDIIEKVAGWSGPMFDSIVMEIFKYIEEVPEVLSFYETIYGNTTKE
jgi:hypothetical protein